MHDKTLRSIVDLQTRRCVRDSRRQCFVEGVGHFVAAVDCGALIEWIVYSPRLLTSPVAEKLIRHQRRSGVSVTKVSPEAFRSISKTHRASGVAAVVRQNITPLEDIDAHEGAFWLVLETVRSPGNLGTLMRTSAAIGGGGLILIGSRIDPFDPAAVRSSMSALFRQRLVRAEIGALDRWMSKHTLRLVGASPDGELLNHQHSWTRPALIALGDERTGLSPALKSLCETIVRIPMLPRADSLNLGVAGGLMMYEAVRETGEIDRMIGT